MNSCWAHTNLEVTKRMEQVFLRHYLPQIPESNSLIKVSTNDRIPGRWTKTEQFIGRVLVTRNSQTFPHPIPLPATTSLQLDPAKSVFEPVSEWMRKWGREREGGGEGGRRRGREEEREGGRRRGREEGERRSRGRASWHSCRHHQANVLTCFVVEVPNLQGPIMATRHLGKKQC